MCVPTLIDESAILCSVYMTINLSKSLLVFEFTIKKRPKVIVDKHFLEHKRILERKKPL